MREIEAVSILIKAGTGLFAGRRCGRAWAGFLPQVEPNAVKPRQAVSKPQFVVADETRADRSDRRRRVAGARVAPADAEAALRPPSREASRRRQRAGRAQPGADAPSPSQPAAKRAVAAVAPATRRSQPTPRRTIPRRRPPRRRRAAATPVARQRGRGALERAGPGRAGQGRSFERAAVPGPRRRRRRPARLGGARRHLRSRRC